MSVEEKSDVVPAMLPERASSSSSAGGGPSRPGTSSSTIHSRPGTATTVASDAQETDDGLDIHDMLQDHEGEGGTESKSSTGQSPSKLLGGSIAGSGHHGTAFKGTLSPMHESLQNTIRSSSTLSPIHAEVKNLSYWYESRSKLGACVAL